MYWRPFICITHYKLNNNGTCVSNRILLYTYWHTNSIQVMWSTCCSSEGGALVSPSQQNPKKGLPTQHFREDYFWWCLTRAPPMCFKGPPTWGWPSIWAGSYVVLCSVSSCCRCPILEGAESSRSCPACPDCIVFETLHSRAGSR